MAQDPPAVIASPPIMMTENENEMKEVAAGMMDKSNSASFAQITPHIANTSRNADNTVLLRSNACEHDGEEDNDEKNQTNCSFDAMIKQATSSMLSPNPPGKRLNVNNAHENRSLSNNNHTIDSPSPLELYSLDKTDDYMKYGANLSVGDQAIDEARQELLTPRNNGSANTAVSKGLKLSPTQESTTSNTSRHSNKSNNDSADKTMIIHRRTWWCLWGIVVLVLLLTGIGFTAVGLGVVQISTSNKSTSGGSDSNTVSNNNGIEMGNTYWSGDAMELEIGSEHSSAEVTTSPSPSIHLSPRPTLRPSTQAPSDSPSDSVPTRQPSDMPSDIPSDLPSDTPSDTPSDVPSDIPSGLPSISLPSAPPTMTPPSAAPTESPFPTMDTRELVAEFLLRDTSYSAISRQALYDARTPQGRALLWMTTEDQITMEYFPAFGVTSAESAFEDMDLTPQVKQQILQRYILVTLDLSLHMPIRKQSRSTPTSLLDLGNSHLMELANAGIDIADTATVTTNGWAIENNMTNENTINEDDPFNEEWNDDEIWAHEPGEYAWSYPDLNECEWIGVECDDGAVTSINWARRQLTGTVAPELALLTNLRNLDLAQNEISGSLDVFWTLPQLRVLYLFDNEFQGRINREIASMSSLRNLYVGHNRLTGSLPESLFEDNLRKLRKYSGNIVQTLGMDAGKIHSTMHKLTCCR